jgi:excisionase family DNA binding protein
MSAEDMAGYPPLMSAVDVAEVLHCSADTVRRMWDEGTLPWTRINGRRRTPAGALGTWLDQQSDKALAALKEDTT